MEGLIGGQMGLLSMQELVDNIRKEYAPLLVDGEDVTKVFRLRNEMIVFTNKRLILVDQAVTGKKAAYITVPYSQISAFAKVSTGLLDLEAKLKIWIHGNPKPIVKEFKKDSNVNEVYQLLSQVTLG